MPHVDVDGARFTFPDGWRVTKFDEWSAYRKAATFGHKACDLVAVHGGTLYLIEAKDYTYPDRVDRVPRDVLDTIGHKALCTAALLFAWSRDNSPVQVNDHDEILQAVTTCHSIRVCLNIELKDGGRGAIAIETALANLTDQLKRRTKFFATGKPIVSSHHQQGRAAWTSARLPATRADHRDR